MTGSRKYLTALFVTVSLLYAAGVVASHYLFGGIAPQFSGDVAFNQKVLFLRDHRSNIPAGMVVGSSMALNNLDSDMLQAADRKPWINLGIWGVSHREARVFYDNVRQLRSAREVVLVTQFFELGDRDRFEMKMAPSLFRNYVQGQMGWVEEFAYRDLVQSLREKIGWKRNEGDPNNIQSLLYSATGAVPVHVFAGADGPPAPAHSKNMSPNVWTARAIYVNSAVFFARKAGRSPSLCRRLPIPAAGRTRIWARSMIGDGAASTTP